MFLVLDSSIICQDLRFTGNAARILIGNYRIVPVTLAVPDVVIDEVTNHFSERLTKVSITHRESHKSLKLLVPDAPDVSEVPGIDRETVRYRDFLLQQVSSVGGRTLPYPEIPHQTIVKREPQPRKSFKENGS